MKRFIVATVFFAICASGVAYAASPDAVKDAVKSCCEAMEKCCCCDKGGADKPDAQKDQKN